MEFITQCFVKNKNILMESLILSGFSYKQIIVFLPNAASAIHESTEATSLYQTMADLLAGYPYDSNSKISIDTIANKSGMDFLKVAIGLNAIAPVLLHAFAERTNYNFNAYDAVDDNSNQGWDKNRRNNDVA